VTPGPRLAPQPSAAHYGAEMTDAVSPTMWLLVGLPAAGKTTRARELESERDAIRLTPDDVLLATLGTVQVSDLVRDALEGQLLDLAVPALRGGVDVVVDFGLWPREERTALRWLAARLGARAVVEHLDIDEAEQLRRVQARADEDPRTQISAARLGSWRGLLTPPAPDELADGAPLDRPPPDATGWGAWAAERWPGLRVVAEEDPPPAR